MRTISKILTTSNYNMFSKIDGNRLINKLNYKRIKESIEDEYLPIPIIVNENFEVIDGQHRLEACKELKIPVYYVIIYGLTLKHVQKLNSISKRWSTKDYLDGYADMGKSDYIIFRDFINEYKLGDTVTLMLLMNLTTKPNGDHIIDFKCGKFKVVDFLSAELTAKKIEKVGKYYDGNKRGIFVFALVKLLHTPSFNFDVFMNKLKYQSTKLVDCGTINEYIKIIEDIYNYKNRNKVRFF